MSSIDRSIDLACVLVVLVEEEDGVSSSVDAVTDALGKTAKEQDTKTSRHDR